jgi:Rieske Fe-S protein
MKTHLFCSLKATVKRLTMLIVGVVMLLSLTQTAVLAASDSTATKSGTAPGISEPISGENINEMKEQRREWQSKASTSRDVKENETSSLGETLKEKLNLDEIIEGYHPEQDATSAE